MKKAVYPGSFDPITVGHLDIIKRLSPLYDEVIVLVSSSPNKSYLFSTNERKELLEKSLLGLGNVKVDIHEGLTVDYLRKINANVIVRGLRAVVDFEYEMAMASMNKRLAPEIETALIFASPDCYYISSRAIKEIARFGGNLDGLVPTHVQQKLLDKLQIK
jgi:pantetheine-phosphate adenylyltransferase